MARMKDNTKGNPGYATAGVGLKAGGNYGTKGVDGGGGGNYGVKGVGGGGGGGSKKQSQRGRAGTPNTGPGSPAP